jgi:hypothetical protein
VVPLKFDPVIDNQAAPLRFLLFSRFDQLLALPVKIPSALMETARPAGGPRAFRLAPRPIAGYSPLKEITPMKRTRQEVADTIEGFVNGTGRQWDWDGFTSIRIDDPELEAIRQKCISVRDEYPPEKPTDYCSPAGMEAMRKLAGELRAHAHA